jgi:hypothetical protein
MNFILVGSPPGLMYVLSYIISGCHKNDGPHFSTELFRADEQTKIGLVPVFILTKTYKDFIGFLVRVSACNTITIQKIEIIKNKICDVWSERL